MSIHMMAMSDFGKTLIILGLEAKTILLKMWVFLRIFSVSSDVIQVLVTLDKEGILTIFRYDLD